MIEPWQVFVLIILLSGIGFGFYIIAKRQNLFLFSRQQISNSFINRQLKKYAKDKDLFYLKDMYLQVDVNAYIKFEGVLITHKYVYIICQQHFDGILSGNILDNKWILKNKTSSYVDNPIFQMRLQQDALKHLLRIKAEDFVIIVSLGRKTHYKEKIVSNKENEYIVSFGQVLKTINRCEKSCPFSDATDSELERIANAIYDEHEAARAQNKALR